MHRAVHLLLLVQNEWQNAKEKDEVAHIPDFNNIYIRFNAEHHHIRFCVSNECEMIGLVFV